MIQLHHIQLEILKKLLFSESLKYSELRPDEKIENNKLTFHIDRLLKDKLIIKNKDDRYELTQKGKEYANRMDTDSKQIKKQGKIGVVCCCLNNKNEEDEFLVYTRLKQPFFKCQGYSTGKVWYGESPAETAIRELKEEANLEGKDPKLLRIEHQMVYNEKDGECLEDKYFFFYLFINPKGEIQANEEGKFEWVKESKLEDYVTKPFESFEKMQEINKLMTDPAYTFEYKELRHITDDF